MKYPRHLAIIMDGNGRWAQMRNKPRLYGHIRGAKRVREVIEACARLKISYLTLYAFSMENWLRPKSEVESLMYILIRFLKKETPILLKENIRLTAIGDLSYLPDDARCALLKSIEQTKSCNGMELCLAISYGARQEITLAVRKALFDLREKNISIDDLNETVFSKYLYTTNMPDPDLIIRTSGESRLSNFLLWQAAYSEIYISTKPWPSFYSEDLHEALIEFSKRGRRFGKVIESDNTSKEAILELN